MMEPNPDTFSKLSATRNEEHIWLLQQQYPERMLKHFSAWQLDADIDIPKLELAIKTVIEPLPDLNARYRFNNDGEVEKVHAIDWQSCAELIGSHSETDATEQLLAQQLQRLLQSHRHARVQQVLGSASPVQILTY